MASGISTSSLPVRFVSLTADPEYDTPEVLKTYADRFGVDGNRWHFLTGPRTNINALATQQLLLAVQENPPEEREDPNDLYLHSTKWVLIDGSGQLRAIYEGTDPMSVTEAARDIRKQYARRGGIKNPEIVSMPAEVKEVGGICEHVVIGVKCEIGRRHIVAGFIIKRFA